MKLAISNLALPAFDHVSLLPRLREMGVSGLEVAPGQVWAGSGPEADAVGAYRAAAEAAGLQIVGLHALLDHRPDLGLFHRIDGGPGDRIGFRPPQGQINFARHSALQNGAA